MQHFLKAMGLKYIIKYNICLILYNVTFKIDRIVVQRSRDIFNAKRSATSVMLLEDDHVIGCPVSEWVLTAQWS